MFVYGEKEKSVLSLKEDYLVFLDEVGDPYLHWNIEEYKNQSIFPAMTITAIIIEKAKYKEILIPKLYELKKKFFDNEQIYLHSREIRRKDGIFKIFLDARLYSRFKMEIDSLLGKTALKIISSSINKINLLKKAEKFQKISGIKYNIGDIYLRNVGYIFERLGHFLKQKTAKIIFETRGKNESRRIQAMLSDAKKNGTFYCPKESFVSIDENILFFTKKDAIGGLQIADYCTYPFARHCKNPKDKDNKFFEVLRKHIYKGNYGEYGLKEWP